MEVILYKREKCMFFVALFFYTLIGISIIADFYVSAKICQPSTRPNLCPAAIKLPILNFNRKKNVDVEEGCATSTCDSNPNVDTFSPKWSRVELVLGKKGLQRLKQATVILVGANDLALEIAHHLLINGLGKLLLWDNAYRECRLFLERLGRHLPGASVSILHNEPDWSNLENTLVIYANQPLAVASKANSQIRHKNKFIACCSLGPYGIVLSDFGDDHIEFEHTELESHEVLGNIINDQSGEGHDNKLSKIRVEDVAASNYRIGDLLLLKKAGNDTTVNSSRKDNTGEYRVKVIHIDKKEDGSHTIVVDLDTREWKSGAVLLTPLHPETRYKFFPTELLIHDLLNGTINTKSKRFKNVSMEPARLVIAPNKSSASSNVVDAGILACFLGLDESNVALSTNKDEIVNITDKHLYDICNQFYKRCNAKDVSNFNALCRLNVPAGRVLIGALVANEAIKGITGMFKPSDVILIDRTDAFTLDVADLNESEQCIERVKEYNFLMAGAGALGCEYLKLLTAMGVEKLDLIDSDVVEESNLTRQLLFGDEDIGHSKAICAVSNLRKIFGKKLEGYNSHVMSINAATLSRLSHLLPRYNKNATTILMSAVDNLQTRLLLDNFAIEHGAVFIEAGVHSTQCSTTISVPHTTESYSTTLGEEYNIPDGVGCAVKGIPRQFSDVIYHSVELFSLLFGMEHNLFNSFIQQPMETIKRLLSLGPYEFKKGVDAILAQAPLIIAYKSQGRSAFEAALAEWSETKYKTLIGKSHSLGSVWLDATAYLKMSAIQHGTGLKPRALQKRKLQKLVHDSIKDDKYRLECIEMINELSNDKNINELMAMRDVPSMTSLKLDENDEACVDFLYTSSNIRASKYGLGNKERLEIVRVAKNIVPAISTVISVAAAMSLYELYKYALMDLMQQRRATSRIKQWQSKHEMEQPMFGDVYLAALTNIGASIWYGTSGRKLQCFKGRQLLLSIPLYPYDDDVATTGYMNNFLDLSSQKHVGRLVQSPGLFKVADPRAVLYGLHLSFWDYITINSNSGGMFLHQGKEQSHLLCGDVIKLIEQLFHVYIDAIEYDSRSIEADVNTRSKPLSSVLLPSVGHQTSSSHGEDYIILRLVARDVETGQPMELPDVKYFLPT